jgi:hypothetical protein
MSAVFALLITGLFNTGMAQQIVSQSIPCESYYCEFTVNARPDTVWARLNTTQSLAQILGFDLLAGLPKMVEIGNAASLSSESDTGILVLTFLRRRTEMRFTFESDSGLYISHDQWQLFPYAGNQTMVHFLRRRNIYIPQTDVEVAQQEKLIQATIQRLKSLAETQ